MTLRVYLDTCVYNRPFDDQTQPRIWLETLAFSIILQMLEANTIHLISSTVVAYEISRNPHRLRRDWVEKVTHLAVEQLRVNQTIRDRAITLEGGGLTALDALHLACAETANTDYFITVDDRLNRRYQRFEPKDSILQVCDPTEFVRITGENV